MNDLSEASATGALQRLESDPGGNCINSHFQCVMCAQEHRLADIEAGWTRIGLQVRCRRHQVNLVHIDFEGRRPPAWVGAVIDMEVE